ncbi:MAG: DUF3014 domain-containing protein [Gammaproteobacteria bacterium]|nr:DUF3014 domain-containing protein [Gammaproteobacteria bacterium]
MKSKSLLVISGVAISTLLYLIYLAATFESPEGTTTIVIPPPALQVVEPDPEPIPVPQPPVVEITPEPDPEVEEPLIEPVEVEVAVEPELEELPQSEVIELPDLNNSDSFAFERLRQLQSGVAILAYLKDEQIIRRFVVLVDNISKGNLPQSNLPYKAIPGEMPVSSIDENLFVMDVEGFTRFDKLVDAVAALDARQAMAVYRLFSPLFQQAYAEIGYRDVNFDITLRRAIRNVLNTDEIEGPFQLVKPSVMYLYADADIENMADVQKQIIRLGPENAEKLKTQLRQFLQQL